MEPSVVMMMLGDAARHFGERTVRVVEPRLDMFGPQADFAIDDREPIGKRGPGDEFGPVEKPHGVGKVIHVVDCDVWRGMAEVRRGKAEGGGRLAGMEVSEFNV
jgi:hypothetical protein